MAANSRRLSASDTAGIVKSIKMHPGGVPENYENPSVDIFANREEHHRVRSFREDFVDMLEKAGVKYDPKYLD